jgi:tight adherence protein C
MELFAILTVVLLVGVAVYGVVVALTASSGSPHERLGHIGAYGYSATDVEPDVRGRSVREVIDGYALRLGNAAARRMSGLQQREIQRELVSAGLFDFSVRKFLGYRLMVTAAFPVGIVWLLGTSGTSPTILLAGVLLGVIIGWKGPMMIVQRRAKARLKQIEESIPELIDLLVVTLEAGASFSAALRIASERISGPLGQEVRLTIQEQALGLTNIISLENWLKRCDTPSVRSFVRSMVQGDRLGVPISHILRNQAVEMRARRKAVVEERAQKAPVKILFPLVLLIFPALFIIILGPAALQVATNGI